MQQATHPRLHVRDAHDAHVVFEAVRQGFLHPIVRRLNDIERATIVRSGAIFVWIECEDDAGLKRWTDGRIWSQGKMRDPYLFYDEISTSSSNEANYPSAFRFVDSSPRHGPPSSALSHQDRATYQHSGLVKQAYTAWVSANPRLKSQKWHLTAYFTYSELSTLPTIDKDSLLRRVIVPTGIYRTGYASSKSDEDRSGTGCNNRFPEQRMPSLTALHSMGGSYGELMPQHQSHGTRLPEDSRVIQMLNSRHIM